MKQTMFMNRLRSASWIMVRAREETGASMVEFAFSFLVLMAMVLGVMQMGIFFYTLNFVGEASREAARYASVRGTACSGFSDCNIDGTGVSNFVAGLAYPGINPSSSTLTVSTSWPGSATANPPNNSPGNPVIVTVSYKAPILVPLVAKSTFTLTSTSQMWISQ